MAAFDGETSMATSACPNRPTVQAFSIGRLPAAEWNVVAAHVEECRQCLDRLEELDEPGDVLVEQLRRLPDAESAAEPAAESWERSVLHSQPLGIRLVADAGGELARRLQGGPVFLDRFELQAE